MLQFERSFDLAVVGAGICGLAHALAAARRGRRVIVIDRDLAANGASIRNFGLITVTGQEPGRSWNYAMRSREIWGDVVKAARIGVPQRDLLVVARRHEAMDVLEAFQASDMGRECSLLRPVDLARHESVRSEQCAGGLHSPHELRVESRDAIPRLAAWLEEEHGVAFLRGTQVWSVCPPMIETSRGSIRAEAAVICPGDDFLSLEAARLVDHNLRRCTLQMMRVRPAVDDPGLPSIMSDLGLVRYRGYLGLDGADALRARIEAEQPAHLEYGIHLIAVRSADGSQVVGDSHLYDDMPKPFASAAIDELILSEYNAIFRQSPVALDRWTGTYATGPETMLRDQPRTAVHLVIITSGTGASTSFGIAEETIEMLWGSTRA